MKKNYIYILLLLVICLTSCKDSNEGSIAPSLNSFLSQNDQGIYRESTPILKLDENIHQVAFNNTLGIYRIQTNEQDVFIHCSLSKIPYSVGEKVMLTVDSRGVEGLSNETYEVELKKFSTSSDSFWLWSNDTGLGFLISIEP